MEFGVFGLGWDVDPCCDVVWLWEPTLVFQNQSERSQARREREEELEGDRNKVDGVPKHTMAR